MTEQDLRIILSRNIRKFRGYRKLSQADFAEKIDISIPFLSDIENGKKWISPVTLAKMANALNIEAFELLKPETIIPDDTVTLLEKFSADIFRGFGDTIENTLKEYLRQLKNSIEV